MTTEPEPAAQPAAGKPPETLQEYFVLELRRLRRARSLSQSQLAERINYSPGLVGMVETLQRHPTADFTKRCHDVLETGGALSRLLPLMDREAYPSWFRSYVTLEAEALAIETLETQMVPGLLQTEDYARAVLAAAWPPKSPVETERRLAARLDRHRIFDRETPPLLSVVIDESALRRPVGGADVMAAQLRRLVEIAHRPRVKLNVLTFEQSAHTTMDGAFVVLDLPRQERVAYIESTGKGQVLAAPQDVETLTQTFGAIRSEAVPSAESVAFIDRIREELYEHR
ncbi:MAG: DUF5753 domain-containing protein [Actinocatenispora sp.]